VPPKGTGWIRLNTNEAPLPPPPSVAAALAEAAATLHHYPHPLCEPLRSAIAAHHGVAPKEVIVGPGADGVLALCFRAFCDPGSEVILTDPTYPVLHELARLSSLRIVPVPPIAETLPIPHDEGRITFIVNPSVPRGTWVDPAVISRELGAHGGVVVVDEAYAPFAPATFLPHLADHPNWLVVRSFSKAYGLAGLRVGYAIGSRDLIADLAAVQDPYPVGSPAIAAALAVLEEERHHRSIVRLVRSERTRVAAELAASGWDVPPSEGNFLFVRPPGGAAERVAQWLHDRRILVRTLPAIDPERVRITVGHPGDNDRLLEALEELGSATPASVSERSPGTTDPRTPSEPGRRTRVLS
jgi:histidinol-phosphate aminotransferase